MATVSVDALVEALEKASDARRNPKTNADGVYICGKDAFVGLVNAFHRNDPRFSGRFAMVDDLMRGLRLDGKPVYYDDRLRDDAILSVSVRHEQQRIAA